ncbi:glycosyltransferase [Aliarcobacter butzleri]|uniref:glycosyltransferase n=1 Tax=Aliarcobacter butzleri TaxID=28197 RepID=UPI002B248060|nr:glycosyltransferase [Aliarcobacter butzleri]
MGNIVLIIDSLVKAGAETTNIRLSSMFIKAGYSVHIISLKNEVQIQIPSKVIFHTLNYKKNKLLFNDKLFSKKLKNLLDNIPDKKLILGSLGLSHKLMNFINDKFNFYYVLHGNTTEAKLNTKKGIKKFIKKNELEKLYTNKNIIAVSNAVKNDILTLNIKPKSIQTIYNPFDFEEIYNKSLKKIDIKLPSKYIVHIGRFAKVKRHDILIKAFSKINDKDLKLILVGDGEEKQNIESLIKKLNLESKVILTGFLDNPYPIVKNAKLLVLSSENEGFGNVIIEALSLNIPVISTATIGAKEILKDFPFYLSKINDYIDLSNKISIALKEDYKSKIDLDKFNYLNIIDEYTELTLL